MAGINWSELAAKAEVYEPRMKTKAVATPKKETAPVITWSMCKCDRKHKSARTFFECAIGKKYSFNGSNAHLNRVYPKGDGLWTVMSERWSDNYYSEHNGRTNNLQHLQVFVYMYETFEEASEFFLKAKNDQSILSHDAALYKAVIKVAL